MRKEKYSVVSKFNCCGKSMVTVIMNGAACVMEDVEFNKITDEELKYEKRNKLKIPA